MLCCVLLTLTMLLSSSCGKKGNCLTRVHAFDVPPLHYFKIKPQRQKEFMRQEFLCIFQLNQGLTGWIQGDRLQLPFFISFWQALSEWGSWKSEAIGCVWGISGFASLAVWSQNTILAQPWKAWLVFIWLYWDIKKSKCPYLSSTKMVGFCNFFVF